MSEATRDAAWAILPGLVRRAHTTLVQADDALATSARDAVASRDLVASMNRLSARVTQMLEILGKETPQRREIDDAAVDVTHDIDDLQAIVDPAAKKSKPKKASRSPRSTPKRRTR